MYKTSKKKVFEVFGNLNVDTHSNKSVYEWKPNVKLSDNSARCYIATVASISNKIRPCGDEGKMLRKMDKELNQGVWSEMNNSLEW